jgi:hypothetical protein
MEIFFARFPRTKLSTVRFPNTVSSYPVMTEMGKRYLVELI